MQQRKPFVTPCGRVRVCRQLVCGAADGDDAGQWVCSQVPGSVFVHSANNSTTKRCAGRRGLFSLHQRVLARLPLFPAAPPVPNYCHSISSSTSATQLFLGTWETILAICRRASALVSVPTRTTHRELNHELNSTQRIIHKRWRLLQFVVVLV